MAGCASHIICQHTETSVRYFPACCHNWSCEACGKYKLRVLRRQIAAGRPDMMLTLTCDPAQHESPTAAATAMIEAWKLLVKRIKRHYNWKTLPFFYVFEAHKSGWPHLHILLRAKFMNWQWLRAQWIELTGAHRIKIERLRDPTHAARYITKYITKAPARFGKMKRYSHSRGWPLEKPLHTEGDWRNAPSKTLPRISMAAIITSLQAQGYTIVRSSNGGIEALKPTPGTDPPLWECGRDNDPLPNRRAVAESSEAPQQLREAA